MKIFELLRAFLFLGVGEGEGDPDPNVDPNAGKDDDPAPDLDVDLDAPDPDPKEDKEERPSKEEFDAIASQAKADKERADRFEREMADLKRQRPQGNVDEITRREEERLANKETSDLERWQIQANRTLRQNTSAAHLALSQAHDVSDRTAFRAMETKKPVLFKKYETKVEEELAKLRANGSNASREAIFTYLIGKDALDDKFARKKPAEKKDDASNVRRGKLPGARSDISGKTGMTEHEKRRARLQDVQI